MESAGAPRCDGAAPLWPACPEALPLPLAPALEPDMDATEDTVRLRAFRQLHADCVVEECSRAQCICEHACVLHKGVQHHSIDRLSAHPIRP